jgi:hypothetical protein
VRVGSRMHASMMCGSLKVLSRARDEVIGGIRGVRSGCLSILNSNC